MNKESDNKQRIFSDGTDYINDCQRDSMNIKRNQSYDNFYNFKNDVSIR